MRRLTLSLSLLGAFTACGDSGSDTTGSDTEQTTAVTGSAGDTSTGTTTTGGAELTTGAPTTAAGDSESGSTTSTIETTAADATGTGSPDTSTGAPGTTGTTGDSTTGEGTSEGSSTGGATSPLKIAIVDAELYADCMPVASPDPVKGQWYVDFDNTDNPEDTMAVVTKASLSLPDADPVEAIEVTPTESGPILAGEYASQKLTKLQGEMHSACEHCGEFYLLVLEYDEGGVKHHVQEDVTISCSL